MRVRTVLLAVLVLALFPVTASANYPHVVVPGETLTSVAAVDGLSIEAIAAANGISPDAELLVGQVLWIPPRSAENTAVATASASTAESNSQSTEETTEETAEESSSSTPETTATVTNAATSSDAANSSDTSSTAATSSDTASNTTASSTDTAGSGGPQPTQERVSAGEIAYVAQANGVPAGLAEAIAWQESGWNNAEVSGVGAVGVMQIVPATWDWIDRYLTPSSPLGTTSAAENVRGGVLLLHQLLQMTGGDEQLAVAGYYQGIASVQAHGMYADTRRYVNDVLALASRLGG